MYKSRRYDRDLDPDGGTSGDGWTDHQEFVAKVRKRTHRPARQKRPGPKPKRRYIPRAKRERREYLAKVPTPELYGELSRRAQVKRRANMTPEKRKEIAEKAAATKALSQSLCLHENSRPMARHPNIWYCPSCQSRVPKREVAKTKKGGELETVT